MAVLQIQLVYHIIDKRLSLYVLTAKERLATMCAKQLKKYKLKYNYSINTQRKVLQELQYLHKRPGKQYAYMHKVVYKNKLEHKSTLTPLDPRLLYVGPI